MPTEVFLGAWVAAGLTLFIYSFLYKDNPFFKLGEHLYVGVSLGYTIVRIHYDVMMKTLYTPMVREGKWWLLLPTVLGLLILARFIPKLSWLSRMAFAFIVGFGSGMAIPRVISSYILQQVQGTLKPVFPLTGNGLSLLDPSHPLNTLVILVGVVAVLFYFFFSIEHTGPVHAAARVGVYFLMISFGAGFGYTVMARMSLLIGRFDDLLRFASKEFAYASPILLVLVIIGLALWEKARSQPEEGPRP